MLERAAERGNEAVEIHVVDRFEVGCNGGIVHERGVPWWMGVAGR
jgi:hypothetical protein